MDIRAATWITEPRGPYRYPYTLTLVGQARGTNTEKAAQHRNTPFRTHAHNQIKKGKVNLGLCKETFIYPLISRCDMWHSDALCYIGIRAGSKVHLCHRRRRSSGLTQGDHGIESYRSTTLCYSDCKCPCKIIENSLHDKSVTVVLVLNVLEPGIVTPLGSLLRPLNSEVGKENSANSCHFLWTRTRVI